MISIMPEPHIPFGAAFPMVPSFNLLLSIETLCIAPFIALMPELKPPPSKHGPADVEHVIKYSLLPITTSPFVPRSMKSEN